ncbi:MAG TPA: hypothetical protein VEI51_03575 [Methanomicrobiales archaeon]|nr:hypothetical protein [Methanomicrobiales archaeon]
MGSTGILLFAGAVLLVAAMIASGCVQDNGSPAQVPGGQATPTPGTGPRYGGQGQRFQPNFTAAAEKLGVTEQQLRDALNTTFQGRRNLTAAAQQLGVTTQQLSDALGFRFNASAPRPGSQPPQG